MAIFNSYVKLPEGTWMKRQRSYFLYCNVITCSSANLAESPRRHGDRSFDSLCAGHHRGTGSHIHPERRLHEGVDNGNNVWGNHRRYDVWCTGRRDLYRKIYVVFTMGWPNQICRVSHFGLLFGFGQDPIFNIIWKIVYMMYIMYINNNQYVQLPLK